MEIDQLRELCLSLPHVKEDIKWQTNLCFSIGEKLFYISSFGEPFTVSLKVTDEEFISLVETSDIIVAPYIGRYKWIQIQNPNRFSNKEWAHYLCQSYDIIKSKLPRKVIAGLK